MLMLKVGRLQSSRYFRLLVVSFIGAVLMIYLLPSRDVLLIWQYDQQQASAVGGIGNGTKIILFWTKYFEWPDFAVGFGHEPFVRGRCAACDCITTNDRRLLNHSDAVLFHARDLKLNDLPRWRQPHQRFVFFNHESPAHTDRHVLEKLNDFFNWTMTYRRDSDIVTLEPYGRIRSNHPGRADYPLMEGSVLSALGRKKRDPSGMDLTVKNRTVAWFVSNCRTESQREIFVRKLSKVIPVDVYGACGSLRCEDRHRCDDMLRQRYRFYLSFENSLCPDYVTEKLYRALSHDAVPVVYGGADYSRYLPVGSYINAADFDLNPEKLADYLNSLMADDELYRSFFKWKEDYHVDHNPMDGWCQLCQSLHNESLSPKSYPDLVEWWSGAGHSCSPSPWAHNGSIFSRTTVINKLYHLFTKIA